MRLATIIACTLWVTMVGIVPPVPPVVGPLVASPAAAGPCGGASTVSLSSRVAAPLSAVDECALKPKRQLPRMRQLPRAGGGAGGEFHHGLAGKREGSAQ
jgi:hypothetical protein